MFIDWIRTKLCDRQEVAYHTTSVFMQDGHIYTHRGKVYRITGKRTPIGDRNSVAVWGEPIIDLENTDYNLGWLVSTLVNEIREGNLARVAQLLNPEWVQYHKESFDGLAAPSKTVHDRG